MKTIQRKEPIASEWRELTHRKEEFSRIIQLLVEFDEKSGRHLRYHDPETHYMRRAIAAADPQKIRVFLRDLGGFIYSIVAEVQSASGLAVTAWVHEDGIRQEREDADDGHPVHGIVCVTDLFERDAHPSDAAIACVSSFALDLMSQRD